MGNSVTGTSHERNTLAYFDRLPRSVRVVVANANLDWALRSWLLAFERGEISSKDLAKKIRAADARETVKQRRRIWGPDYPAIK
jgi:hypothetical protein